jgi:hypothetical protein
MWSCLLIIATSLLPGQAETPSPTHQHLKEMECFVGDWIFEGQTPSGAKYVLKIATDWTLGGSFQEVDYLVEIDDRTAVTIKEVRGWDPATKRIKVWMFRSTGGHGEGFLSREGEAWVLKETTLLPDGNKTSSTVTSTFADKDAYVVEVNSDRQGQMRFKLKRRDLSK